MLGRVLERILDAQAGWTRPLGDRVQRLVAAIFGRMLPIRDFLAGAWLGHPLHALLTDVPIGALTLVIVLDIIGQPTAADVALVIGVLSMLAAALAGYADYSTTDGKARDRATIHSTLMLIALVVYLVSLGIRLNGPTSRTLPIVLSIVAYLILAGGAFVGGDVVYALGNVVDRHAWRPSSAKWQPLDVGEIDAPVEKVREALTTTPLIKNGALGLASSRIGTWVVRSSIGASTKANPMSTPARS